DRYPAARVVVLDNLSCVWNQENLEPVRRDPRFCWVEGNICDAGLVREAMIGCDTVVNFAAEPPDEHSLVDPGRFVQSHVYGTYVWLEAAVHLGIRRSRAAGTSAVYGTSPAGAFRERAPLRPSDPDTASKAGGEMLVHAYHATYGLPAVITRAANAFGPYQ